MLTILLWAIALAVAIPLLTVSLECLAALSDKAGPPEPAATPSIAVLIPAHDEAGSIAATLKAARAQLAPTDRLVVVADNCSDATAAIARAHGAETVERHDAESRGKGFALAFGRDHLRAEPPSVVLVLDADTLPAPGAIRLIAAATARHNAALQGCYLIEGPSAEPRVAMSTLAFRLKNFVRQKGLQRVSGHALLQGSGMAFPWALFSSAPLATASLVEDLQLGVDLYLRGERVGFAEYARFTSAVSGVDGTVSQRTRWEHGSMASAPRHVGGMIGAALRGRLSAWPLALDLMVPPLGMLAILAAAAFLLLGMGALLGQAMGPLLFLTASLTLFGFSLGGVWHRWGRDLLPPSAIHRLALYLIWKLPILARFLVRRERRWVRTDREPINEDEQRIHPPNFHDAKDRLKAAE
jgi:cellulose synthase/poly-beta-1,6-N-acetylglucosamine synthase-like glycosyltransferase